jgi:hypothetical protein
MAPIVAVRHLPAPLPGVCGLVVDQRYEALEHALDWVEVHGTEVDRIDPETDSEALRGVPEAQAVWNSQGAAALPMVLVDGHVISRGRFPSAHDLAHALAHRRTSLDAPTSVAPAREAGRAAGLDDEDLATIVRVARNAVSINEANRR